MGVRPNVNVILRQDEKFAVELLEKYMLEVPGNGTPTHTHTHTHAHTELLMKICDIVPTSDDITALNVQGDVQTNIYLLINWLNQMGYKSFIVYLMAKVEGTEFIVNLSLHF